MGLVLLDGSYSAYFRFQGLTSNANQLAMVASCALFVSLGQLRRKKLDPWWTAMVILGLVVGYFSASDAFRIGLLVAVAAATSLSIFSGRRTFWGALLLIASLVVSFVLVASLPSIIEAGNALGEAQGGQGSERTLLWGKCANIFLRYPLAGIGPATPVVGTAHPTECHNSFLDIATGGGVLALFSMLCLLAFLARKAWRAKDPVRIGMIAWLMTFMMFGYQVDTRSSG